MHEYCREVLADLGRWARLDRCAEFVDELGSDASLIRGIEACVSDEPAFRTKTWGSALDLGVFRVTLYALLRSTRPAHAVETGVLHGLTSAYMLSALDCNQHGRLTSIDLPSFFDAGPANHDGFADTLPRGRQPGWAIPARLRGRWELHLGSSRDLLARCLGGGPIGLFLHDSEHTYDTMSFELGIAWPMLSSGGFLVCDNVDTNVAFFDFCRSAGQAPFVVAQDRRGPIRFGILRK